MAFVIAGAFGKVVEALVNVIMSIIGKAGGQPNFNAWKPAEIPLGALIPQRVENLLPAGKNIGTTHITNGAYRLHPVEWNIGEAAGALAAYCLDRKAPPRGVRHTPELLSGFQEHLIRQGVELRWPDVAGY